MSKSHSINPQEGKRLKKYGRHAESEQLDSYIASPRQHGVEEREFFSGLKEVNTSKVSITIGGKPTLSRVGK